MLPLKEFEVEVNGSRRPIEVIRAANDRRVLTTKNAKYEGRIPDPKLVSLRFSMTKNVVKNHATQIKIMLRADEK